MVLEGAVHDGRLWEQNVFNLHADVSPNVTYFNNLRSISKGFQQAYTVASCVADTIGGTQDQPSLRFARVSETESEFKQSRTILAVASLPKANFLAPSGNISEFRVRWVSLPQTMFNHGAFGAVVLHPQTPNS